MDFLYRTNSSFDATVWYTWILRASAPWLSNLVPIREAVDLPHLGKCRLSISRKSKAAVGHPLVYRLAYNGDVVALKMGRRQGGPSRTGGRRAHA